MDANKCTKTISEDLNSLFDILDLKEIERKIEREYSPALTIDLHGHDWVEAMKKVAFWLASHGKFTKQEKILEIICGQGKHSKNKIPKLKPLILQYLDFNKIEYFIPADNPGRIKIITGP